MIELLVVVAVIALLIALLLPALDLARRQAQLMQCAANQRQIGLGLLTYTVDEDNRYPPPCTVSGNIIYSSELPSYIGTNVDNRQIMLDIVDGLGREVLWCPIDNYRTWTPEDSGLFGPVSPNDPYIEDYFVWGTADRYGVGYALLLMMAGSWDWRWSGNPNEEAPRDPGDDRAAILADLNINWTIGGDPVWGGDWDRPWWSNHAGETVPFRDSNTLYGDGHVQTETELRNYTTWFGSFYAY